MTGTVDNLSQIISTIHRFSRVQPRSRLPFRNIPVSRKWTHLLRTSRVRSKPRISIGGPFGEVIKITGTASGLPFRFSTKYQDDETGLLFYGYRYYQLGTGHWSSRDPLEEQAGMNLYECVHNNPICSIDPDGQLTVTSPGTIVSKKCGGAAFTLFYFTPNPGHVAGFIVQQIDFRCQLNNCPCQNCPNSSSVIPTKTFWEAFPVSQTTIRAEDIDTMQFPANTCGSVSKVGTIKFFSLAQTTSDPPGLWPVNKTYGTGNCIADPGGLHSTDVKPNWWDNPPLEGSATRWTSGIWNCCCSPFVQYDQNPTPP